MNTSQDPKNHGEFIPGREVQVHHEPWMERMVIYCKIGSYADGCRMYATRPHGPAPYWMIVAPMEEPPLYLVIGSQEAEAISEALSGVVKKRPAATERHLDDAIAIRNRLLTMMEAQQITGLDPTDAGVNHLQTEATIRSGRR